MDEWLFEAAEDEWLDRWQALIDTLMKESKSGLRWDGKKAAPTEFPLMCHSTSFRIASLTNFVVWLIQCWPRRTIRVSQPWHRLFKNEIESTRGQSLTSPTDLLILAPFIDMTLLLLSCHSLWGSFLLGLHRLWRRCRPRGQRQKGQAPRPESSFDSLSTFAAAAALLPKQMTKTFKATPAHSYFRQRQVAMILGRDEWGHESKRPFSWDHRRYFGLVGRQHAIFFVTGLWGRPCGLHSSLSLSLSPLCAGRPTVWLTDYLTWLLAVFSSSFASPDWLAKASKLRVMVQRPSWKWQQDFGHEPLRDWNSKRYEEKGHNQLHGGLFSIAAVQPWLTRR